MMPIQDRYDEAMLDFSMGDYDSAINKLKTLLAEAPTCFDAQLALGMAYCRKGDLPMALTEGHKAAQLKPNDPLVHTNLSIFYQKSGNKQMAEHHGMQARIASWRSQS
jgi:Flp pilus assembly protein TadD